MSKRKEKKRSYGPKVAAAIEVLRDSLGPSRPGKFQDLADGLAASGCSIKDFQKAAAIFDEQLLWEMQISDIWRRLAASKVAVPETFTYEQLLRIAAASGDKDAQTMLDGDVLGRLG
jgi:hypothetical protein